MGGFIYAHNSELLRSRVMTWEHVDIHDNTEDVNELAERGKSADIIIVANLPLRKNVIENL